MRLARPSLREREQVVRRLQIACAEDRVSLDTLSQRLEIAYTARSQAELDWLVADLPEPHVLVRAAVTAVTVVSRLSHRLETAWRAPRLERLTLPTSERTIVGRSRASGCVVSHPTVSRAHALVRFDDGRWSVRDLGSTNGTFVNGSRIAGETEIRPGDEVGFGAARFALVYAAE